MPDNLGAPGGEYGLSDQTLVGLSQKGQTDAVYRPQDQNIQSQQKSTKTLGHGNRMPEPTPGQVGHPSTRPGTTTLLASSSNSRTWPTAAGNPARCEIPCSPYLPGEAYTPNQNTAAPYSGGRVLSQQSPPLVLQNAPLGSITHGRAGPEGNTQANSYPSNRLSDNHTAATEKSHRSRRQSHGGNVIKLIY